MRVLLNVMIECLMHRNTIEFLTGKKLIRLQFWSLKTLQLHFLHAHMCVCVFESI